MQHGRSARLGAQLWVERDSTAEQVDHLVGAAAASGLGELRIFLIWPWIEPQPGVWRFELYDCVFAAAKRHHVMIKATLTPDTPPWHAGGPGLVQSTHLNLPSEADEREKAGRYIDHCVRRYRDDQSLNQWLLWNEPFNPGSPPNGEHPRRGSVLRSRWVNLVRDRFDDDLEALNRRWHTGYPDFDSVDLPEEIAHPAHRGEPFFSFDPWLCEAQLRAQALAEELQFVRERITALDPRTPTCLNPPDLFRNHAGLGYDFATLVDCADVLGASVHAPWHLDFADRSTHVGLAVASVRLLREAAGGGPVELTEVQAGNVYHGSPSPLDLDPATVAAWFLAPMLAGADGVAGWALNSRQTDFEAGDWGLLDDDHQLSERSAAVVRVRDALTRMEDRLGPEWSSAPVQAVVCYDERSQAVRLVHSWTGEELPGRDAHDEIRGTALISHVLTQQGVPAAPASLATLRDRREQPDLIVVSHLGACPTEDLEHILSRVQSGSCLLIDGTSAQKDLTASVHRPWPGLLSERLGYRVRGMITRAGGQPLTVCGAPAGSVPLGYADLEFTHPDWVADPNVLLVDEDQRPMIWSRSFGAGQVVVTAGPLGPSLVHDPSTAAVLNYIVGGVLNLRPSGVRSLSPHTTTVTAESELGQVIGVFGPSLRDRQGRRLRVLLDEGVYDDLWSGDVIEAGREGAVMDAGDGVALLIRSRR